MYSRHRQTLLIRAPSRFLVSGRELPLNCRSRRRRFFFIVSRSIFHVVGIALERGGVYVHLTIIKQKNATSRDLRSGA